MRRLRPGRVALELRGLIGLQGIFRVSGVATSDPAVAAWFAAGPVGLRSIAQTWFFTMRRCGDDVREMVHDGSPVACVEDAPFGYVSAFKRHVNVGFFYGAALEDPAGLLEGSGKRMRHVKLFPGSELNAVALRDLVTAAYADVKRRLGALS
jgi:hypothetical protein